jgi:hypothetical protein
LATHDERTTENPVKQLYVGPTRLQRDRKANERLAEKHINRSWDKELEGAEIYCQRQEKIEGTYRQPVLLTERWTLLLL